MEEETESEGEGSEQLPRRFPAHPNPEWEKVRSGVILPRRGIRTCRRHPGHRLDQNQASKNGKDKKQKKSVISTRAWSTPGQPLGCASYVANGRRARKCTCPESRLEPLSPGPWPPPAIGLHWKPKGLGAAPIPNSPPSLELLPVYHAARDAARCSALESPARGNGASGAEWFGPGV